MAKFFYDLAFSRNIGWVTRDEQARLRHKRVAIAGLGGVGGSHLLTLARLGVSRFSISDFDTFDVVNFNRQAGAFCSTLGEPKSAVLANMARDVNPRVEIEVFPEGLNAENTEAFLHDADVYVDGLDFFALEARMRVFAACAAMNIPAITAAPLGMGAAVLNFLPGKMSFEAYFRLDGQPENEQLVRFLLGLSPAMLHRGYLVDPTAVDFLEHRGPSTPMACDLCAGMAGTQVLKIVLGRGKVLTAPWGLHFDAYRNRLVRTWRPGGNRHPLQRIALAIARRQLSRMGDSRPDRRVSAGERTMPLEENVSQLSSQDRLNRLMSLATAAPSGDNCQPWRLEIEKIGASEVVSLFNDPTRDTSMFNFDQRASMVALGALVENLVIGASSVGFETQVSAFPESPASDLVARVELHDAVTSRDPLIESIPDRRTTRGRYSPVHLGLDTVEALYAAASIHAPAKLHLVTEAEGRRSLARSLSFNDRMAFESKTLHSFMFQQIRWSREQALATSDGMPVETLGLDPLDRWAFSFIRHWPVTRMLNSMGLSRIVGRSTRRTIASSAAFGAISLPSDTALDFFVGGRALERVWLQATRAGLAFQPLAGLACLFQRVRAGDPGDLSRAGFARLRDLSSEVSAFFAAGERALVMIFRLGKARNETPVRTLRRPLSSVLTRRDVSDAGRQRRVSRKAAVDGSEPS